MGEKKLTSFSLRTRYRRWLGIYLIVMAELGREDPLKIKMEVQLLGKKFERRFATVDSSLNELKSTAPKYQIPKVVLTPKETIMVPFSY